MRRGKDLFVCNYVLGFYSVQHLLHRGPGSLSEILGAMTIGIELLFVEISLPQIGSFARK